MSEMCFVEQGKHGVAKDGGNGRRRQVMSLNLIWLRNMSLISLMASATLIYLEHG